MKKIFFILLLIAPVLAFAQPCATINSTSFTMPTCVPGGDATVTVNATASAGPIMYSIGSQPPQSSPIFINISAGIYTVYAIDNNNCMDSAIVTVFAPGAPSFISQAATNVLCNGGASGTISVTATPGTHPSLSYSIAPNSGPQPSSGIFSSLPAGCYTITVSDGNSCQAITTVCVTQPPMLNITTNVFNNNPCDADTVLATASGGTPPFTYTINPSPIPPTPTGFFLINNPGTYTIEAVDANNCSVSSTVVLTPNVPVLNTSQVVQPPCGTSNGSITANITWPNTTFNYLLNPGNITNTTGNFTGLAAGTYYLAVQSPNCTSFIDSFRLTNKLNPYPITTTQNTFTATAPTNGTAPYSYTLNSQALAGPQSGLRCTGVDTFRITDGGNCTFDTTFSFVAGNSFPSTSLNKNITDASCALTNDGQIIYAPSSALAYYWLTNSNVNSSTSNNITSLIPDTYVVRLTNTAGDCIQDTSVVGAIGTACGNIIGKAFWDTLVNCNYDAVDVPLSNVTVTLMPGNIQRITNASGDYQFLGLPYGNYTVAVDTNGALGHYPSCNLLQFDTLSITNVSDTNYFPHENLTPVNIKANTFATLKANAAPPRNFSLKQDIQYGYVGLATNPINVNVYALMDSIHHYDTASIAPTAIMGDTIMWTMNNITITNNLFIYYKNIQSLPINHKIPFAVWVEPITALIGNTTADDSAFVELTVVTSYDPNDKQVNPQGIAAPGYIEKTDSILTYKIRFQNTGNAMAFNIFIEDTISNRLDINSLQVLDASHPYLIEKENDLLRFRFNNVMLPDSNADEPNSHGYIIYTIKQDAGNIKGDEIKNTAHIYFDFNPAVVTNTTLNTIGLPVGVENVSRSSKFKVYPNPSDGLVYIQELENYQIKSVLLNDMLGRQINVPTQRTSGSLIRLSVESLPTGMYMLNLDGESVKLIKE